MHKLWTPLASAMRDAGWLSAARARAWCRMLALVSAVATVAWIGLSNDGVDRLGKPVGTDFISFWTASQLALSGQAAAPYDLALHAKAQKELLPAGQAGYYAFFYPPMFLLLCLPLALLPYLAALAVWLAASLAALLACVRRVLPYRWAILPALAFPGVLVNAGHGQNGFISASCLGAGMLLMPRRPFLAGMCLGALVFKPHLLLAVPVALLAARRWAAIAGGILSMLGLAALSWLVLGQGAWRGFLQIAPLARATLEEGMVEPWKMQSVFAAVRVLHGTVGAAYAAQLLAVTAACLVLGRVAARRPGGQVEGALTIAATLCCTPFLLDYDLVCLMLPIAWVTAQAQRNGWQSWEKVVLLAAYALPLFSRSLAMVGIPVAPVILAALLLVVARRASQPQACSPGPSPARRSIRVRLLDVAHASAVPFVFGAAMLLACTRRQVRMRALCLTFAACVTLCGSSTKRDGRFSLPQSPFGVAAVQHPNHLRCDRFLFGSLQLPRVSLS